MRWVPLASFQRRWQKFVKRQLAKSDICFEYCTSSTFTVQIHRIIASISFFSSWNLNWKFLCRPKRHQNPEGVVLLSSLCLVSALEGADMALLPVGFSKAMGHNSPVKNQPTQPRSWGCFLCLADGFGPVFVWPCHHDSYSGNRMAMRFFFQLNLWNFVEPQKLARVWRLLQSHHFGESWRTEASWRGQDCLYLWQ